MKEHFINGIWVDGMGSEFSSTDPATEALLWQGKSAEASNIKNAIDAAKAAFQVWKNLDLDQRIDKLKTFHRILSKRQNFLAEQISKETGKPLWEAKNEVGAMLNKIDISIEAYHTRCPVVSKEQQHGSLMTRHQPHGVLAVFGPFNFPAHLPNGHIIPALLAGNTILFKPSELTPLVAQTTMQCWEEASLPNGVINLLQGGRETGQLLAEQQDLDGILFTGSWPTGQHLSEQMAKTPYKILALEMGGNNPLVVSNVNDISVAAYLTIQSAFLSSGQRCTCARRLIVIKGKQQEEFLNRLIAMIKKIQIGPYTTIPEPFMGPLIDSKAAEKVIAKQQHLIDQGGKPLLLSKQLPLGKAFLSPGVIDVTEVSNRPDEEIFGPILQLIRVSDFDSALEEANRTRFGLVAGLLSERSEEYEKFFRTIRAGVMNWNTQLTGASSTVPFGGIGQSGNNRPSAFYAADYCSYPVASLEAKQISMPKAITPGIEL